MKKIFYPFFICIFNVIHCMDDTELKRVFDEISKNIAEARAASQAIRDTCQDIQKDCDKIIASYHKVDDVAQALEQKYGDNKKNKK